MRVWPAQLIAALWLLWAAYWALAALGAKPAREREGVLARAAFLIPMAVVGALLLLHHWPAWLRMRVVGGGWMRYWSAVGLIVIGLSFSIWARRVLGANWSGTVTVKVQHELVQLGPYRRIRHPIYTGVLLAILGTGLAAGEVRGLVAFALAFAALWLKSRAEERWMEREFGERYAAYRRSSRALVPFLL